MNPAYVYSALIDVLSYRFRLKQDIDSGVLTFKEDLEKALSIFDSVNSAVFSVQAVSDTIILTCNTHENFPEFLSLLKQIFLAFLERGLYVRGGVAYSKHFHSGRLTYSHAVARAYDLESKVSIYPRIVIDENIIEMYSSSRSLPQIFNKNLLLQQNKVTFLNVIDVGNWEKIYEFSNQIYTRDKEAIQNDESAFLKHQWFENYIFSSPFLNSSKKRYIEPIKEI